MARRSRWSDDERRELLAACEGSGLSATAFCAETGVPLSTLAYWKRRAAADAGSHFVPVEIARREHPMLDVVVGAAIVRVPSNFDDAHLARIVRALSAC
ncbi:MAG: hypothetical protein K8T90_05160 [Planctomycetes bacterium]|nr:hypothetical protein [Planctomycetota bacterium]